MTDTTTAPRWNEAPTRVRVGRALTALAGVAAAMAAASMLHDVVTAPSNTRVVETWRMYGLATFAGLFALLAWRPLAYRGLWELVIANKLALTITGICYAVASSADDTGEIIAADGILTVVLVASYILVRGWRATRSTL
ncbi:MAG: hypothetical protein ACRDPW_05445 [Mycobacteriales bacterium]